MEQSENSSSVALKIDVPRYPSSSKFARKSISLEASSTISCKDLTYSVTVTKNRKKEEKTILNGIDALFRPGRLTAIMGASGAGKTTLLNYLAGELSRGHREGEVAVNGFPASFKDLKRVSAFVFQDDVILDTMTVREAISMSALLRLPRTISKKEREERVDAIIEVLQLTKCENTKIGSPEKKGISGGERKRTSMAMDMVVNPSVLILDEPTSGLDTFTAFNVMTTLADLAHEQNRTIVATIHQPSSEIFHMLDDLLLISGGKVVYHGPVEAAVEYFSRLGFPCPVYTNPADYFFMQVLNETNAKDESAEDDSVKARLEKVKSAWEESPERKSMLADIDGLKDSTSAERFALATCARVQAPFLVQFGYLMGRAGKNLARNFMIAQLRVVQSIVIGLILAFVYYDVRSKDPITQVANRFGALHFFAVNQFMSSAMGVVTIFVNEKNVFTREYSRGYYSLPAYFLSKTLVEMPSQLLMPFILVLCGYWLIGLRSGAFYFFRTVLILILVSLNGVALGTFAGAIFKDISTGMAVLSICMMPFIIFSGLAVNNADIPKVLRWIPYIAPTRYGFTSLARNEFEDYVFPECKLLPAGANGGGGIYDCTGNSGLKFNKLDEATGVATSIGILFVIYLVLMLLAYLTMFRLTRSRK